MSKSNNLISIVFDRSLQFLINEIHLPIGLEQYENTPMSEKINRQFYECNIIIFSIISEIVWKSENVDLITKYSTCLGNKLRELNKEEENNFILNIEFSVFIRHVVDRIGIYQEDIKKLMNSNVYSPPLSILYYFINEPASYYPDNKFTETKLNLIVNDIENGNLQINDLQFSMAIKDVYNFITQSIREN